MNIRNFQIIIVFLIASYLLTGIGYCQKYKPKNEKKLIIVAMINNNYNNVIKDTNFQFDDCIKLKVDTITQSQMKMIIDINGKKRKDYFDYKNIWCRKEQVFDINKKIDLSKYHIKSFIAESSFMHYLGLNIENGACITNDVRNILNEYKESFYKYGRKSGKIYLDIIMVESDDGENFQVNTIVIELINQ